MPPVDRAESVTLLDHLRPFSIPTERTAPGEFMQQRRLRLGDILDDYCPRERRITNHAVVAMIDMTIAACVPSVHAVMKIGAR